MLKRSKDIKKTKKTKKIKTVHIKVKAMKADVKVSDLINSV